MWGFFPELSARADSGLSERGFRAEECGIPAEALMYYVIALGLFMAVLLVRSCGLQWLGRGEGLRVAGKAAISQARSRLRAAALKALWEETPNHWARMGQPGCFYRGLRLMAVDGSTLDVPDTAENLAHFGKQSSSRGEAAFRSCAS